MNDFATETIKERIVAEALEAGGTSKVTEAIVGLGYTLVCLNDTAWGLAYTLREGLEKGCETFSEAGTLVGTELESLLPWIGGSSPVASSVALAAANAVLKVPDRCLGVDLLDSLDLEGGERVVTVGRFRPMESSIERKGVQLEVIEWGDSPRALERSDVALITGTSIINNTLGRLLEYLARAREVVILGPSTPYAPRAFKDTPVTLLAGSSVSDPIRVRQVISEGGGTRTMKRALARWVERV
ncbi:MAG: DUF364 domain-containing protein [Actinomycetota bacterium]|nr:DUF364 domain-containing protein [Actinomycetota bacterium]